MRTARILDSGVSKGFLPLILIIPPSRRALAKARTSADRTSWHAFVAATKNATYEAFDYTVDCHSRDLEGKGDHEWIKIGVMGRAYWGIRGNLDDFSCSFASDLVHNTSYFEDRRNWKAHMYNALREDGGTIHSKLTEDDQDEEATIVTLDRDVWELTDSLRKQVEAMLRLKEDKKFVYC